MNARLLITLVTAAMLGTAGAETRKWTDASTGRAIEADFVSQTATHVTLKLKDGKEVTLARSRLSKPDHEFLKSAAPAASAAAPAAAVKPGQRPPGFNEAKIDKRTWKRPATPKNFGITSVDFSQQIETEHFIISGSPKVKPDVMDAYAETCERTWVHLARDVPAVEGLFKDRRMAIWLSENEQTQKTFGSWLDGQNDIDTGGNWETSSIGYIRFRKEAAQGHGILGIARGFRTNTRENHRNLKWPGRVHFIAGDIFAELFDEHDVKINEGCQTSLIELGLSYYMESDICGNIETKVSFGYAGSAEGFKNGRAWPAAVKRILANPSVQPGVEKLLKTRGAESQPMDVGAAFGFIHWALRDEGRRKAFNGWLATCTSDAKVTDPAAMAKAFGFDSPAAFDAAFVAYLKSDQFK